MQGKSGPRHPDTVPPDLHQREATHLQINRPISSILFLIASYYY